jgi:hypothetical protein
MSELEKLGKYKFAYIFRSGGRRGVGLGGCNLSAELEKLYAEGHRYARVVIDLLGNGKHVLAPEGRIIRNGSRYWLKPVGPEAAVLRSLIMEYRRRTARRRKMMFPAALKEVAPLEEPREFWESSVLEDYPKPVIEDLAETPHAYLFISGKGAAGLGGRTISSILWEFYFELLKSYATAIVMLPNGSMITLSGVIRCKGWRSPCWLRPYGFGNKVALAILEERRKHAPRCAGTPYPVWPVAMYPESSTVRHGGGAVDVFLEEEE